MTAFLRFNLIVFSLLIALAACGASPQVKKARYLESGDKFFAMKQYREAVISYSNALRVDANDKNIYMKLSEVFFEVGDINQCLSNLQKARDIDPEDLDIRLKMARCFAMVRKTAESRQELDFILEIQLLAALSRLADHGEAPGHFEPGIKVLGIDVPGFLKIGQALIDVSDFKKDFGEFHVDVFVVCIHPQGVAVGDDGFSVLFHGEKLVAAFKVPCFFHLRRGAACRQGDQKRKDN